MPLNRDRARTLAEAMSVVRMALGVGALLAPRLTGRMLFTAPAAAGSSAVAVRMFGGRDLAMGLGTLLALRHDAAGTRGWIEAGALADALDAVAFLADGGRTLRRPARIVGGVSALTATAAAPVLTRGLRRE